MSYIQVLTPVNNSQLLLMLEILDKLRLVTLKHNTQKLQHYNFSRPWFTELWTKDTHRLGTPFLLMWLKLWHFAVTLWYNIIITHVWNLYGFWSPWKFTEVFRGQGKLIECKNALKSYVWMHPQPIEITVIESFSTAQIFLRVLFWFLLRATVLIYFASQSMKILNLYFASQSH